MDVVKILRHVRHANLAAAQILCLEDVLLRERLVRHKLVKLRSSNDKLLFLVRAVHFEILLCRLADLEPDKQPAEASRRAGLAVVTRELEERIERDSVLPRWL